ncbi:MAG: hypothetical protein COU11_03330 [Candidatus Harrisonbacteria bacterium CG10_big_fil_rev_8_21_14_0_10_49_15]|uniref:Dipeptidylpeptidase IV N-terminal domain-containing protein n=1 Tax=Candidatus Harrisonbacteria bacterium CG10_big_fil_rev_8_21_14_0_10_49_15 TaxID=1974587 RepID=A0A2H0UKE7_9BACT|nr:MAG: hypothetical protein COU11_03330 [Candidatus Harrisonbacteria bacterium CG10_big_fil_rev_8_21_14_0_10_49_15]
MKRKLIIIGIVLVLTLVVVGYFFALPYMDDTATEVNDPTIEEGTREELVVAPVPLAVTMASVFDYWVRADDSSIYYVTPGGTILQKTVGQEAEIVSTLALEGLRSVTPSNDGSLAIIEFGPDNQPQFRIFNATSRSWRSLPETVRAATWSPDATRIAYLEHDELPAGQITLYLLDIASGVSQRVSSIHLLDAELAWPTADALYISTPASGQAESYLWRYLIGDGTWQLVIGPQRSLAVNWIPDTDRVILFEPRENSVSVGFLPELVGGERFFKTLPSKCTAAENILYCAVPQDSLPVNFFDEYHMRGLYTADSLLAVDFTTEERVTLWLDDFAAPIGIDAYRLEIAGDHLYFMNRYDGRLYSLELAD